jgi:hypothetical protein
MIGSFVGLLLASMAFIGVVDTRLVSPTVSPVRSTFSNLRSAGESNTTM